MTASVVPRSIVLGPDADEMRRALGPLAWAALESLVTDARPAASGAVVHASIRSLADRLGVARNTAHRAVSKLRRAGLLEHAPARTATGQFATGSYRLTVTASVLSLAHLEAAPSASPSSEKRRSRSNAVPPSRQLSLLPPA